MKASYRVSEVKEFRDDANHIFGLITNKKESEVTAEVTRHFDLLLTAFIDKQRMVWGGLCGRKWKGHKQPGLIMSAAGPHSAAKVVIWWTLSHCELGDVLNQSSLQCHWPCRSAPGQLMGGCMGTGEGAQHNHQRHALYNGSNNGTVEQTQRLPYGQAQALIQKRYNVIYSASRILTICNMNA